MLLVLGIMLAMAPQNICRCSISLPSGLQNFSHHGTADLACALCSIFANFSFYARRSLQYCSSIFSTSSSENFCLSQILCSCKQDTKSLESSTHKSGGSIAGNCSRRLLRLSCLVQTLDIPMTICSEKFAIIDTMLLYLSFSSALPLDLNPSIVIWTKPLKKLLGLALRVSKQGVFLTSHKQRKSC